MKILVTGVHGFIGGSLARYSLARGHEVLGVGRTSQSPKDLSAQYMSLDVQASDLAPTLDEFAPDVVLHCAGSASVQDSFRNPAADFRASVGSLQNLLDSVRRSSKNPLVVFPSSAAVYGNPQELPVRETAKVAPISPYGFHKLAAETIASSYVRCFGLKVCVCRLFSVFGPAQRRLLIWELFRKFSGPSPTVELAGTGSETRDYLHIEDVADAMLQLAQKLGEIDTPTEPWTFNIASGDERRIADLAAEIGELGGWHKAIHPQGATRHGDPQQWRGDGSRLRLILPAWQPHSFSSGLAATILEWKESDRA